MNQLIISASLDQNMVSNSRGTGGLISESGMYDVNIMAAFIQENKDPNSKVVQVGLIVKKVEDMTNEAISPTYLWNAFTIVGKDGNMSEYGTKMFNMFLITTGVDTVNFNTYEQKSFKTKSDKPFTAKVLKGFTNKTVTIRLQKEYSKYNNTIQSRLLLKNLFNINTKASAEEIAKEKSTGVAEYKQYNYEKEKANQNYYRDGLTESEVIAYEKEQANLRKASIDKPKAKTLDFDEALGNTSYDSVPQNNLDEDEEDF